MFSSHQTEFDADAFQGIIFCQFTAICKQSDGIRNERAQ